MIRLVCMFAASAATLLAASCCCTSDVKPPGLRPMPQFQEIQVEQPAPGPVVEPTK